MSSGTPGPERPRTPGSGSNAARALRDAIGRFAEAVRARGDRILAAYGRLGLGELDPDEDELAGERPHLTIVDAPPAWAATTPDAIVEQIERYRRAVRDEGP